MKDYFLHNTENPVPVLKSMGIQSALGEFSQNDFEQFQNLIGNPYKPGAPALLKHPVRHIRFMLKNEYGEMLMSTI